MTRNCLTHSDTEGSPNFLHKQQVIAAAKAGKHVFCQKPLAITVNDCKEMIAVCKQNGVQLAVGFCYRFGGAQQKAKEMLDSGAVGQLSLFRFSFNLMGYDPETVGWRCDPKLSGGGPLMDLAPHMIDMANFFTDSKVESVMSYVEPELTGSQVETDALAVLQYTNGVKAVLDMGFNKRAQVHNYSLVGDRGVLNAEGTMPWLTNNEKIGSLQYVDDFKPAVDVEFSTHEHLEMEIATFCEALENDTDLPIPGEDGLDAQVVIEEIYESARTGMRIVL